jgi:hypothetical protein
MESFVLAIFDLVRDLLSGRSLWGILTVTVGLLTLTLLGVTGRVVLWLETIHSREQL